MSARWLVVYAFVSLTLSALPSLAAEPHKEASLDARVAEIVPKPSEDRWLQVPWRTNLMAARRESQATGKPLFLWVMVGNPQGCT